MSIVSAIATKYIQITGDKSIIKLLISPDKSNTGIGISIMMTKLDLYDEKT